MEQLTLEDLEAMEPGDVIYDYDGDEITRMKAGHWEYTCIGGDRDVASFTWSANELVHLCVTRTAPTKGLAELVGLWERLTPEEKGEFRDMII